MGSVVAILVGLTPMSADGPTRHGHRLASESFRLVLGMEVAAPVGKTAHDCRDSRLASTDMSRQPVVESPPHSWGTAQGGYRGGAIDGGQVSATAPEAAHAELTNIEDFIEQYYNQQRVHTAQGHCSPEEFKQKSRCPNLAANG